MTLKEKLTLAWRNKNNIVEGFYNAYISSKDEIKQEALNRLAICRTNQCGYHDPKGESEKAVFKGRESCGGCGCDLVAKVHAMSSHCYLKDQDKQPLWDALITQEQQEDVRTIANKKYLSRNEQHSNPDAGAQS
jgi:hypothetical protein